MPNGALAAGRSVRLANVLRRLHAGTPANRSLSVSFEVDDAIRVKAAGELLVCQVLEGLLEAALSMAPEHASVQWRCRAAAGLVVIEVGHELNPSIRGDTARAARYAHDRDWLLLAIRAVPAKLEVELRGEQRILRLTLAEASPQHSCQR